MSLAFDAKETMKTEIEAPICVCGLKMVRSRRRALKIDGWICKGAIHDFITKDMATADRNHSKPVSIQFQ